MVDWIWVKEKGRTVVIIEVLAFKIYAGILDRVRKVTESLSDDKQGLFRVGRGCADQIFILKQIGEKAQEKT